MIKYGAHFRQAREVTGLTLRDAARKIGITEDGLGKIERGESGALLSTLVRMAMAYDCEVGDLFPRGSIGHFEKAGRCLYSVYEEIKDLPQADLDAVVEQLVADASALRRMRGL